jgi:hypothetical protein
MSLQPRPWPEPADEIATAVRAMYRGAAGAVAGGDP